ncbi:MAG TPA: cupin domain-containing protein [Terriglobia bacterium]|nr:cupin domain-containing protein [Terriglobia bacterium]
MITGGVWALLISISGTGAALQAPVPVEQEPHHHVVLKNGSVVVIHVVLPAGESTLYHTHSRDRVSVALTSTTLALQEPNQPEGKPGLTHPGDISAITTTGPYTHRLHNLGPATFEVIDVEFPHRPEHPSPTPAAAVAAENPSARVYRWTLAPGAATPMHAHERPYLILAVTPMQLKMTGPDGSSMTHEIKAGDFHWVDAKVTHSLENAGAAAGEIVEIELK